MRFPPGRLANCGSGSCETRAQAQWVSEIDPPPPPTPMRLPPTFECTLTLELPPYSVPPPPPYSPTASLPLPLPSTAVHVVSDLNKHPVRFLPHHQRQWKWKSHKTAFKSVRLFLEPLMRCRTTATFSSMFLVLILVFSLHNPPPLQQATLLRTNMRLAFPNPDFGEDILRCGGFDCQRVRREDEWEGEGEGKRGEVPSGRRRRCRGPIQFGVFGSLMIPRRSMLGEIMSTREQKKMKSTSLTADPRSRPTRPLGLPSFSSSSKHTEQSRARPEPETEPEPE